MGKLVETTSLVVTTAELQARFPYFIDRVRFHGDWFIVSMRGDRVGALVDLKSFRASSLHPLVRSTCRRVPHSDFRGHAWRDVVVLTRHCIATAAALPFAVWREHFTK